MWVSSVRPRSVILRCSARVRKRADHRTGGEITDQTGTTSGQQNRDYEVASRLPRDRAGVDFSFMGAGYGGTPTGNRGLMSDVPDTN